MPAVEMSDALRGAEYRAGYFDQVSSGELNAMAAAIAFINDPDGPRKHGRRYVFEFELLVKNVCARVGTSRMLAKVAHGFNDLNPLPIGHRSGPTVEFRAMYHLAILLTCLRKAAVVFVDKNSNKTVGHIYEFAGGFCEGTLREWNAICLVAWCKQTGRPDTTHSKTAAPTYRASGESASDSVSKFAVHIYEIFSSAAGSAWAGVEELTPLAKEWVVDSFGGARAAIDSAGAPYMPAGVGVAPSIALGGTTLTIVVAAVLFWAASKGNATAGTQRHLESQTMMILYDNFTQDHIKARWWHVESMDPVRVPSDMRGYHEQLARTLATQGTSIPDAGKSSGYAMTLM